MTVQRLALLSLLLLSLAAPPVAGETLRVRPASDIATFDPMLGTDWMARNFAYMVYDTLFALDERFTVQPQMVDRYDTTPDGLRWTFHLRPGLRFSDGLAVTSDDVLASLARWSQADSLGQQLTRHGAHWARIEDDSFTLTLASPFPGVLAALAKPGAPVPVIMPARLLAATPPGRAVGESIGSGPFIFRRTSWIPGALLEFTRSPTYEPRAEPASGLAGGKRVGFDTIAWHIISDPQTALNALTHSELDIVEDLPPDLLGAARAIPGLRVSREDSVGVLAQIRLNSLRPPFDDQAARAALLAAIDGPALLTAISDDSELGAACRSFYACTSPYRSSTGMPSIDLAAARTLLRASRYDGTPVVLLDPADNPMLHPLVLAADATLRQIGFTTRLDTVDWPALVHRRASRMPVEQGGWSLFLSAPSGLDVMDPANHLALRSDCDQAWFGWPCDALTEELRAAFAGATASSERQFLAEQTHRRAAETVPFIPIGMIYQMRAIRADLDGLLAPPAQVYWNVRQARHAKIPTLRSPS